VAHLADWQAVYLARLKLSEEGAEPELPNPDPDELAVAHGYSESSPSESCAAFAKAREELTGYLRNVSAEAWDRAGVHPVHGRITFEGQVVHILAHDGYHFEYLATRLGPK
jgi:hypothetical protein